MPLGKIARPTPPILSSARRRGTNAESKREAVKALSPQNMHTAVITLPLCVDSVGVLSGLECPVENPPMQTDRIRKGAVSLSSKAFESSTDCLKAFLGAQVASHDAHLFVIVEKQNNKEEML